MLLQTCVKEFSFNLRGHHPSYPLHDEVYLIQHYVIKFASHKLTSIEKFLIVYDIERSLVKQNGVDLLCLSRSTERWLELRPLVFMVTYSLLHN